MNMIFITSNLFGDDIILPIKTPINHIINNKKNMINAIGAFEEKIIELEIYFEIEGSSSRRVENIIDGNKYAIRFMILINLSSIIQ